MNGDAPGQVRLSWDCPLCDWSMAVEAGYAVDSDIAHLRRIANYLVEQHSLVHIQRFNAETDRIYGRTHERDHTYRRAGPPV